jgi:hypothetical protein
MAKAKKTTAPNSDAPVTAKQASARPKQPPAATLAPMVDTQMAAQSAAKQLVAHLAPSTATPPTGKESTSFKLMKQNLAHPAASGLDSVLDKTALPGSRKPNVPFAGPKSVGAGGRNQTFGADVNRTGVPRRTSGG